MTTNNYNRCPCICGALEVWRTHQGLLCMFGDPLWVVVVEGDDRGVRRGRGVWRIQLFIVVLEGQTQSQRVPLTVQNITKDCSHILIHHTYTTEHRLYHINTSTMKTGFPLNCPALNIELSLNILLHSQAYSETRWQRCGESRGQHLIILNVLFN